MTQEQLGDQLRMTFQQVQKYEKGVNRISAGRLFEVAKILERPITYFYETDIAYSSGYEQEASTLKTLDLKKSISQNLTSIHGHEELIMLKSLTAILAAER